MKNLISAVGFAAVAMTSGMSAAHAGEEVNLYSYRQPFLIKPMLKDFTKQTGIKVNVVYAKKGMLESIKAEGENTPADAVLTVDVGSLDRYGSMRAYWPRSNPTYSTKMCPLNIVTQTVCGSPKPPERASCSPARTASRRVRS